MLLDCNGKGSTINGATIQAIEVKNEVKLELNDGTIPESKMLKEEDGEKALIKKLTKKIRLRKKKKKQVKQKKTENRAKKALKTIRCVMRYITGDIIGM